MYCSRPGFIGADFFLEHAEKIDAFNIVSWLYGGEADLEKANEWLEENRDTLTTAKLSNIILEAMLQGDSYFMRRRANIRHADTPATDSRILELWSFYQAKGLSKGNAAPMLREHPFSAINSIRSIGIVNNSAGFRRGNDDVLNERTISKRQTTRSPANKRSRRRNQSPSPNITPVGLP